MCVVQQMCVVQLQVPRVEATTLLASLVSFPNHFGAIEVLSQSSSNSTIKADHFKDLVLAVLLDGGRKEPAGIARLVSGLYIW